MLYGTASPSSDTRPWCTWGRWVTASGHRTTIWPAKDVKSSLNSALSYSIQIRLCKALFSLVLNTSKDGDSLTSVGNPFQYLINFFFFLKKKLSYIKPNLPVYQPPSAVFYPAPALLWEDYVSVFLTSLLSNCRQQWDPTESFSSAR